MERMELRYEELRVPSVYARSSTVDRCRESSCESRHEHCDSQGNSHRGWSDSSQETLPRLGDEREKTSTGSDQRNDRHERSIGMASADYEIRAKHSAESTKSHERNPHSPRDFEWIAIEPSRDPHLVSASGHKLKHYGEQAVPMKLRDGRKIWITFQVCEVNGPIMSVGKFCAKGNDRCATFSTRGGVLWHEEAGEIAVDKVRNHYEMECWIKPGNVLAPVQFGGSSGSAGEPAEHHVAVPQRTDAEILMDAQPQGAYAPRADEEHIEPEILPVASLPGPREPSKEEIESCMTLRCHGVTSASSRRAETTSTDRQDRKSFQ